ncbi:flagellar basal-body MS-ring/collar protein FliF [Roseibaca sp. Y0-43]|uniref:flagellar basal-body MS-ring/collar protein FliF n=1 Tax=Roseibaca sp. Y0-43 TaxID=2816854 RepID=UPI001D0C68E6|nr:flagellar M-ring protein FliF [Roseibaca sp. Y0-43]
MQQVKALWTTLDMRSRLVAGAIGLGAVVVILFIAQQGLKPGQALLYAGLEEAAAGEVIQALEARGVAYEVRGDAIYVPTTARDELRLMLAAAGLPANSHTGYELLDSLTGFGTTSQMFDAAYWRAKEGELARTIVASPHVRSARVHISQGVSGAFRRDIAPTASVSVTTSGGAISVEQAQALRFLVASAVPGMTPQDVSIIDGANGLVLGPDDTQQPAAQTADRARELRRNVERLLEAHVGPGRSVVELSIDTVTDVETITERRIDPESRIAIRAETEESRSTSTDSRAAGVTVASNLPDGDAAGEGGAAENSETVTRANTDYDISETLREIQRGPGAIRRMTVAVLIDGVEEAQPDGTLAWRPRSAEELETLRGLVASAVGFDEARGDIITLESLRFEPMSALGTEARAGLFANSALDLMTLLRWAFLLAVLAIFILFVLRPLLTAARQDRSAAPDGLLALDGPFPPGEGVQRLGAEGFDTATPEQDDPVARLRRMIEERQDESAQLLRHWMEDRKERS